MSSKINLQTCEYARKSSIFQDNQLIYLKYTACFLTPLELLERKIKIRDTSNQYADVSY